MFKKIPIDATPLTTFIIIEKDGVGVATFYGNRVCGQINSDNIKSVKTSYDMTKREKTIVLEV